MIYSHLGSGKHDCVISNAGKTVGTKRPLTQKHIWGIRFFIDREERLRDQALFDFAIDSRQGGCDLLARSVMSDQAAGDMKLGWSMNGALLMV
jgi:hypothetical protein